ncbi:hypothetical protein [Bosea beijingensis]|uniref:hypothetical protein n=1 Tax=Bosea beijingensis TaxID=3068632 RepID=UPI002740FBB9|nr:hypothetical protein [Bosea sp. REN20]
MLDRKRENRAPDRLGQIRVQHDAQTAGAGFDGRNLEACGPDSLRGSRAAHAEQIVQLPAHLSEFEIEACFLQCIHLSTAAHLERSFRL